jgi:hypothetical protein
MLQQLKHCIHRNLMVVANSIAGWASRFGEPQEPPREIPDHAEIGPTQFPPFTGGPEEAAIMAHLPPVALSKKRALTRVDKTGHFHTHIEAYAITNQGKVLRLIDFLVVDDNGVVGLPDHLKGQCDFCSKISFGSEICEHDSCHRLACPKCGGYFETGGRTYFLCKQHLRKAEWNKDLWE